VRSAVGAIGGAASTTGVLAGAFTGGAAGGCGSTGFDSVTAVVASVGFAGAFAAAIGFPLYSIFCQQPVSRKIGATHQTYRIQCNMSGRVGGLAVTE
jgi:hypothetical protein